MACVSSDHQESKFIEVDDGDSGMKHRNIKIHALDNRFIKSVQKKLKYMIFVNCFYWQLHSRGLSGEVNIFVNA